MSELPRSEYAKTTAKHESDLVDETADPFDRDRAIGAITFDRRYEFEPLLREYVGHPEPVVRAAAIRRLVGMWSREDLVDRAIEMAFSDPDEYVQGEAITGLGLINFGRRGRVSQETVDRTVRALVRLMMGHDDWTMQVMAYRSILELLTGTRLRASDAPFDRDKEVDWKLLEPYRE